MRFQKVRKLLMKLVHKIHGKDELKKKITGEDVLMHYNHPKSSISTEGYFHCRGQYYVRD